MILLRSAAGVLAFVWQACAIGPSETVPGYLGKYGIHVETHPIHTDDGYILEAFRLPRSGAPVVLMQHGILSSAWTFIDNDPELAPGIQLYLAGYDVWLTNNRGNTYSRKHTTLNPAFNKKYWNFSFPVLGRHDVPANIKYILDHTGKHNLTYVGWSQGTSQMFVAMQDPAVKPLVDKAVNLFVALSPVSYLAQQKSLLITLASDTHIATVLDDVYPFGLLVTHSWDSLTNLLCNVTKGTVCKAGVDLVCGVSKRDTLKGITNLTAHFPAGCSVKELLHYAQLHNGKNFGDIDYGTKENRRVYGQDRPPQFDMSKAAVPTALFVGSNDDLGDSDDVAHLVGDLSPSVLKFRKLYPGFSHLTWSVGDRQAFQGWYGDMLKLLQTYNPLPSTMSSDAGEVVV